MAETGHKVQLNALVSEALRDRVRTYARHRGISVNSAVSILLDDALLRDAERRANAAPGAA